MVDAGTVQSLIAPRRYIQGRGVLASLGTHVAEIGKQPLVIADENVWKLAGDASWPRSRTPGSSSSARSSAASAPTGRSTWSPRWPGRARHRRRGRRRQYPRHRQGAGHQTGIAWATVPTVASTDAPTKALFDCLTPTRACSRRCSSPTTPVLVDTQLCANAPYRFLVSGWATPSATRVARSAGRSWRPWPRRPALPARPSTTCRSRSHPRWWSTRYRRRLLPRPTCMSRPSAGNEQPLMPSCPDANGTHRGRAGRVRAGRVGVPCAADPGRARPAPARGRHQPRRPGAPGASRGAGSGLGRAAA